FAVLCLKRDTIGIYGPSNSLHQRSRRPRTTLSHARRGLADRGARLRLDRLAVRALVRSGQVDGAPGVAPPRAVRTRIRHAGADGAFGAELHIATVRPGSLDGAR